MPDPKMTGTEYKIVSRMLRYAFARNWRVSVNDDAFGHGEWVLRRSVSRADIIHALASTDGDLLVFYEGEAKIGYVQLIWGNDEDLISDYTDKAELVRLTDYAIADD